MPRFFVNNFATTLSANITNVQTTLPLQAGDGALLPSITLDSPQDEDFLLTIDDGTNREVVRVEQNTGADTLGTIVRNYDGNGAFAFSSGDTVEMRLTALSLQDLWSNFGPQSGVRNARGQFSVDIVPYFSSNSHVAEADRSINIGPFCGINAAQTRSINIGEFSQLTSGNATVNIVIGGSIGNMGADDTVLIGNNPLLSGSAFDRAVKIGHEGVLRDQDVVGVGHDVQLSGEGSTILGSQSGQGSSNTSRNGVIIGPFWNQGPVSDTGNSEGGLVIGVAGEVNDRPIPGLARIQWPRAFGGLLDFHDGTDKPNYANNGTEITIATPRFDNTVASPFPTGGAPAAFFTFTLPTDAFMFIEEIGVVFDAVNGGPASVTTDMVIDVGSSGNGSTEILNAQTVSAAVVPTARTKEAYTALIPDTGVNAITVTLDTPALYDTGDVDCYVFIRGILYQGL